MNAFSVYSKSRYLVSLIAAGFFVLCVLGIEVGESETIADGGSTDTLSDPSSADLYDGTGNAYGLIGNITGVVADTEGEVLSGVEVTFDGVTVITGNDGWYAFLRVLKGDALMITARKEKYEPYSVTADVEQKVDSIVNIVMTPVPDIIPPASVTGLTTNVISSSEIELTWSPSTDDTGVAGYRVYQNGVQGGATTATTYRDTALSPGTQYCYSVTAYDAAGNESPPGVEACTATPSLDITPPASVTGLTTNVISSSEIELTWSPSTDDTGVAGYRVYQDGVQRGSTTETAYSDTGLAPSTSYCYTVTAYDTAGNESLPSSQACTATPSLETENPLYSVTLAWDAPTTNEDNSPLYDLAGFRLHYGTSPGYYTETIDVGNVLQYSIENLLPNTYYYFAVTAYDIQGNESGYSEELSTSLPH